MLTEVVSRCPQASLTAAVRNINAHNKHMAVELVCACPHPVLPCVQRPLAWRNSRAGSSDFQRHCIDMLGPVAGPADRPAAGGADHSTNDDH